jgi:serine/threonine protein kinase
MPSSHPIRVDGKYWLKEKIGSGSFGTLYTFFIASSFLLTDIAEVYLGIDIFSDKEYAVKLQPINEDASHLKNEVKIYKILGHCAGVPSLHWFGTEGDYKVLVTDLLGPSLESLFNRCNRRFSLKTVLLLTDQIVCVFFFFWHYLYVNFTAFSNRVHTLSWDHSP